MRIFRYVFVLLSMVLLGLGNAPRLTPYSFPELRFFPPMPIAPDNLVTVEGAALGRRLFYDPILSVDSTMSCASCHRQQNAFSDVSDNRFSQGRNGTLMTRNTMPLFNLAWYPAYFWDGRASSLEEQVFHPVRAYNEMNLDWKAASKRLQKNKAYKKEFKAVFGKSNVDSIQISYAIAQFLRTLVSYQSKYDQVLEGKALFTKEEFEGFNIVNDQTKGNCLHCHVTDGNALGTALVFSNNGLDAISYALDYKDKGRGAITGKLADYGKFKAPSLRNLAFTAPYMHDGRFKTLEEVINFYSEGVQPSVNIDAKMGFEHHQGGTKMTANDKRKIIAFLLTLSDSTFVGNGEFGNPFGVARSQ